MKNKTVTNGLTNSLTDKRIDGQTTDSQTDRHTDRHAVQYLSPLMQVIKECIILLLTRENIKCNGRSDRKTRK